MIAIATKLSPGVEPEKSGIREMALGWIEVQA